MKIDINNIKINERIRKDIGDIEELAKDIKEHGLINAIVINQDNVLLAGERRLKACKFLDMQEVECRVITTEDAINELMIEIAENEVRKDFTFSERLQYARKLEEIERIKADERQRKGEKICKNPDNDLMEIFPEGTKGTTRDIVAEKTGFGSGKQFEKAKFIEDNGNDELIQKLNDEKISISKAYEQVKEQLKKKDEKIQDLEKNSDELYRKYDNAIRMHEAYKNAVEDIRLDNRTEVLNFPRFENVINSFIKDMAQFVYLENEFQEIEEKERKKYINSLDRAYKTFTDVQGIIKGFEKSSIIEVKGVEIIE